jgi:O-antigen ligase
VLPALASICIVSAVLVVRSESGISLGDENRPRYWHVALDDAAAHPVLGSGAGTFADYWLAHESVETFARDAHSLYLESLAELGPLGLLFGAGSLAVPFLALRRREPILAPVAGAYLAFVVHAGIDWDWEVPAVTLIGIFCGAALVVGSRSDPERATTSTARWALVGGTLLLAAVAAVRARTGGSANPF